jgi:uncharacterized damage-inducible protein DinB
VKATLAMLLAYKTWANQLTFDSVMALPEGEADRHRPTRWESIAYTLSHVWVVDDIFVQHLNGRRHAYTFRNVEGRLSVTEIWDRQQLTDAWLGRFLEDSTEAQLNEVVSFEYVGGGAGKMTRAQILLHLINHGTYHRGLVSDMMYQIPAMPQTNDLTVFVRDFWEQQF